MAKKSKIQANLKKVGVKKRNRCNICGRPRGYMGFFGLCRICFRTLASRGQLPGVTKSSW
ncbi:type Z 30S ribosomal protein S14 [Candidatus Marinamargulisbacteria bacterium SCGC AG-343-D04]|nr:type Z 30S ribosomal protein S14 [Candidatus Marinamargulisbacteria bacterium SCGC AG-343-D04]